eukprot:COSAG06_NODE_4713_length_4003_cov_5.387031_2_plen_308_part_00
MPRTRKRRLASELITVEELDDPNSAAPASATGPTPSSSSSSQTVHDEQQRPHQPRPWPRQQRQQRHDASSELGASSSQRARRVGGRPPAFSVAACSRADHMETSDSAIRDVAHVLRTLASCRLPAGSPPDELRLWDPYYCQGTVKVHYAKHGFPICHNKREENVPLTLGGRALPPTARLRTHTNTQVFVDDMGFTPLVNSTGGSGVVFGHTLGIEMGRNPVRQRYYTFLEPHLQRINLPRQARDKDEKILNKRVSPQHVNPLGFLEGCFHLITPFSGVGVSALQQQYGVGAGFPGVVLSTGMEDYCT